MLAQLRGVVEGGFDAVLWVSNVNNTESTRTVSLGRQPLPEACGVRSAITGTGGGVEDVAGVAVAARGRYRQLSRIRPEKSNIDDSNVVGVVSLRGS